MIILQANKFFYEKGGSERYMFALSRALEARGHEIMHFSMLHRRNLPSSQDRFFVSERSYDGSFGMSSIRSLVAFVRSGEAARNLTRLIAERRPQVAHLHNIYHQLTPSIIDVLADHAIPMVMTLHDYKLVCPSYTMFAHGSYCYRCRGGRFYEAIAVGCGGSRGRSALLAAEAYWQKFTRVYERVNCFIAPSEYLRGVMLESGMDSRRIVHVAQLSPDAGTTVELSGPERSVVESLPPRFVVYAGRLSAEKGVDVLIEAMTRLPEVTLAIFGDGPEADRLRAACAAQANITFFGHAERAVLDHAMARASALIVPSVWAENAPMVVLEAASAGVPVIASDRGGLPELTADTGGRVVPAGDAVALAAAIRDAWNDTMAWKARARESWRAHRARHESDAHVARVEAVYRRVINAGKSAA